MLPISFMKGLKSKALNSFTTEVPTALSYRNQSIDLLWKSMVWFLYDRDLRHERVSRQLVTKIVRKKMLFRQFLISPSIPSLRISPHAVQKRENTDQKILRI